MGRIGYYLGVDGGGTKTEFALTDAAGGLLARCTLKGSNPNDCGIAASCEILRQGFDTVCAEVSKSEVAAFIGIAGVSDPRTNRAMGDFLERQGFAAMSFGGDYCNILSAGLDTHTGLIAIMGTGCVVFGQVALPDGTLELQRTGGWGHLLDDGGSGWRIGRDALFAAYAHHDGSGEATLLTGMIGEKAGVSLPELVPVLYANDKSFIAGFAPVVFAAAEQGDSIAKRILQRNMSELARLLASGLKKLPKGEGYRAVLAGGLTHNMAVLLPLLEAALQKYGVTTQQLQPVVLDTAPVYGALLRAGLRQTEENRKPFLV